MNKEIEKQKTGEEDLLKIALQAVVSPGETTDEEALKKLRDGVSKSDDATLKKIFAEGKPTVDDWIRTGMTLVDAGRKLYEIGVKLDIFKPRPK